MLLIYCYLIALIVINKAINTGEVAERLKALVLKTSNGATRSWVRIPPSPPLNFKFFKKLRYLVFFNVFACSIKIIIIINYFIFKL